MCAQQQCTPEYLLIARRAQRLLLNFRFQPGSSELDSRAARDIRRLKEFMDVLAIQRGGRRPRLFLLGFADSTGQHQKSQALSRDRAEAVRSQLLLADRSLKPEEILGFGYGHAMPVAPNDYEEGRQKNRRVEVWLERESQSAQYTDQRGRSPVHRFGHWSPQVLSGTRHPFAALWSALN